MRRVIRIRRKPRKRCLHSYRRIAHKQYDCWRCPQHIEPGEEYWGEVWVNPDVKPRLRVWRSHVWCPVERFEETSERFNREMEAEDAREAAAERAA